MRLIILAAGSGRRLGALAQGKPKCMVELQRRPLIDWLLDSVRAAGISEIVLVRGFAAEQLTPQGVHLAYNPRFADTNMVYTLWCAREWFSDPFILSYADILYEPSVLRMVMAAPGDVAVGLDKDWESYWRQRVEDPLSDAETLKLDATGRIVEIGAKARQVADIAGGYIGLIKFSGKGVDALTAAIDASRGGAIMRERGFEKLYMTDLLQMMSDAGIDLRPAFTHRGWFEIDTPEDLMLAERLIQTDSSAAGGFRILA
jgi:choline kinase